MFQLSLALALIWFAGLTFQGMSLLQGSVHHIHKR
jgi:hypothetical protein